MPHHQEVDSPALMHVDDEQVSNDQGGTKILGGHLEVEMRNNSFDESQHRVAQPDKVPIPEDRTSLRKLKNK